LKIAEPEDLWTARKAKGKRRQAFGKKACKVIVQAKTLQGIGTIASDSGTVFGQLGYHVPERGTENLRVIQPWRSAQWGLIFGSAPILRLEESGMAIAGSCHCGRVTLSVPEAPDEVTRCNCSLCTRLGALWCYYPPASVAMTGPTKSYVWGDKSLAIHHCPKCGTTIGWLPLDPDGSRAGINARLLEDIELATIAVRDLDGAAF
jgi:hypothetical protein